MTDEQFYKLQKLAAEEFGLDISRTDDKSNFDELYGSSPAYYVEDAIEFIHDKTGIDEQLIEEILMAEDDYMRSIGLIVEIEEIEEIEEIVP